MQWHLAGLSRDSCMPHQGSVMGLLGLHTPTIQEWEKRGAAGFALSPCSPQHREPDISCSELPFQVTTSICWYFTVFSILPQGIATSTAPLHLCLFQPLPQSHVFFPKFGFSQGFNLCPSELCYRGSNINTNSQRLRLRGNT